MTTENPSFQTDFELGGGGAILIPTIGSPSRQIKFGAMLNALFRERRANILSCALDIPPVGLRSFVNMVRHCESIRGFGLTIPHKISILDHLDDVTDRARRCRAVSVVRRENDGKLTGDMNDGEGFVQSLFRHGQDLDGKSIHLLGAGGAACAIAASLTERNIKKLVVYDTSAARMKALAGIAPDAVKIAPDNDAFQNSLPQADIAINATPLGLSPKDPLPFDIQNCGPDAFVADIIIAGVENRLLGAAKEHGLDCMDGVEMLRAQVRPFLGFLGLAEHVFAKHPEPVV